MTSGNINRSLGLSALVIMSIAGLALTGSVAARADINPGNSNNPLSVTTISGGPNNGDSLFTYDFQLSGNETMVSGDSFTIIDFNGFVNADAVMPSDWSMTYSFVGPQYPQENPPDDPTVPNVTFTYSGPDVVDPANTNVDLGHFTIESIFGDPDWNNPNAPFTNRVTSIADDSHGTANGNLSNLYGGPLTSTTPGDGPPVQITPEPGVFVTAASMLSMTGIGLVRGRRRAKAVKTAA